jgi:phage replication-related protein YjqB (UPF0714/DUF867 family)
MQTLLTLTLLASLPAQTIKASDHYLNYRELALREAEGVDYRVIAVNRRSAISAMAIHGGKIEKGTSELARAIARDEFNLYLFEGIKPNENGTLHLTSENFDEPQALELVAKSQICVSIHGFKNAEHDVIYVGGGNDGLIQKLISAAAAAKLPIQFQIAPRLKGQSPRNIVNRCAVPGLQLELSSRLRLRLFAEPELLNRLGDLVYETLGAAQ